MIKTDELKEAMSQLYQIVPKRTTMPILQTVLMKSNSHRVKLVANDIEKSLTLYINSDLQIDACLPAKQFNETVKLLNAQEIDIKTYPEKIIIKKQPGQTTIRTMSSDEFPETLGDTENSFSIDAHTISNALNKAYMSTSTDESHPVLCGVLLKSDNTVLEVCGIDGFRLTIVKLLFGLPDFEAIIPHNAVPIMVKILETQTKANLSVQQNKIVLWNDNFVFTTQLVAGNYPDVKRLVRHEWKTKITVDKTRLSNAIKQALVYAVDTDNLIMFNIVNNELTVIGESNEVGSTKTPIPVDMEGQSLEIAMNGRFLQDSLTLVKDKIIFRFDGPFNPVQVVIPENELLTHILMPMHLGRK